LLALRQDDERKDRFQFVTRIQIKGFFDNFVDAVAELNRQLRSSA
jgi:hypothetical protein